MNAVPAISLGIPVYNGARGITQLITSILADPFENLELIVNDNGSTDGTADLLSDLRGSDPRLQVGHFSENRGVQANFNEVFKPARSPLFKWCAVNDIIQPGYFESIVSHLQQHPQVTLGHCRYNFTDGESTFVRGSNQKRVFDTKLVPRTTHRLPAVRVDGNLRHYGYGGHFFGVHRTELLARLGAHAEYAGTDRVLTAELAAFGPFFWEPEVLWSCFCPQVDPVDYVADYGLKDGVDYPDLDAKLLERGHMRSLTPGVSSAVNVTLRARRWERRIGSLLKRR
jgi:glycosyltransferase involved in cell wall biosynthesis